MYVGNKYTATRTNAFEMEYRCKRCGFTRDCTVVGVGMGQGSSAYFLDNEGAAERAETRAQSDAAKNAELTVKLCPCPKCGARDASGFIAESVLALVGSALLVWGVGWLVTSLKGGRDSVALWIFGPIGLLTPIFVFFTHIRWKWTTAKGRVAFHTPAGGEDAPKKKKRKKKEARAHEAD
jgi:hypothetical protein